MLHHRNRSLHAVTIDDKIHLLWCAKNYIERGVIGDLCADRTYWADSARILLVINIAANSRALCQPYTLSSLQKKNLEHFLWPLCNKYTSRFLLFVHHKTNNTLTIHWKTSDQVFVANFFLSGILLTTTLVSLTNDCAAGQTKSPPTNHLTRKTSRSLITRVY